MKNKQNELVNAIVNYFKVKIFENHLNRSLNENTKLSSYKINPIIVKYLSKIIEGSYTPEGVAKALYLPRVLSTSINTSFGQRIQNMFIELGLAHGSLIPGMDIEFEDKIDGRKKWCQLKSGPNTINSEDVNPLMRKFDRTINLAKTNNAFRDIRNTDFIVGVLYGTKEELSSHYMKIDERYPVIIGQELWHRITGIEEFYFILVKNLHILIENMETNQFINEGISILAKQIKHSHLFDFE